MCMLCVVIRQRKYLRSKFGGGDDTIDDADEDDEDEEGYKLTLGGKKFSHGAENRNFEVRIWAMHAKAKQKCCHI